MELYLIIIKTPTIFGSHPSIISLGNIDIIPFLKVKTKFFSSFLDFFTLSTIFIIGNVIGMTATQLKWLVGQSKQNSLKHEGKTSGA